MIKKFKHIFIDSFWSISGLVLMNFVAQFFVYPLWNKMMGQEIYGNIIFYISLMNIFSITFGSACCYARITKSSEYDTENEDYISVLIYTTIAVAFIFTAIAVFYKKEMRAADAVLYIVLCCLTLWRSYADVEFRLNLNYIGYFTYFVVISAGYILGGSLLKVFGLWTVSLLPGELFGLLFVLKKGSVFKIKRRLTIKDKTMVKLFIILCVSYLLNSIIFNSDRLLLKAAIGGSAVSVYYVSSLFGKTMSLITTPFNSVISGYLAKYKGSLTIRLMTVTVLLLSIIIVAAALMCTLGSYIVLPFLYSDLFEKAKGAFFICNISQTFYFGTNILTVMLLRFSENKFQIYINIVYALAFLLICLPFSFFGGLKGFYWGYLTTSMVRFAFSAGVGYYTVFEMEKNL